MSVHTKIMTMSILIFHLAIPPCFLVTMGFAFPWIKGKGSRKDFELIGFLDVIRILIVKMSAMKKDVRLL